MSAIAPRQQLVLSQLFRQLAHGLPVHAWGLGLLPVVGIGTPALSAEYVNVSYGALERSIPVASLEIYAQTGIVDQDLAGYIRFLSPEQRPKLRQILLARADLSHVAVSKFLDTPQGEILLKRLGAVIRTDATQTGFYALRGALVLAAARPPGLTLLNVLRQFPTHSLRIDLGRSLQIAGDVEKLVSQTNQVTTALTQITQVVTQDQDVTSLADLRESGTFGWRLKSLMVTDGSRHRSFPVDLYLPQLRSTPGSSKLLAAPVIVISHGLGSDRTTFAYLARHLASYGLAVVVPEHPGSNAEQMQALMTGKANQAVKPSEFIDRPLDIKFLLDELQRLSQTEPWLQGRLNLKQVGIMGHSLGGYTALVLVGAPIDWRQLQNACQREADTLNLSLLLQCRALQLSQPLNGLQDSRVKAAIALNPISSGILGPDSLRQIQVPVMLVAGSADTIAPALLEQIQPFTWLTSLDRYLVLISGGTHFSTTGEAVPGSKPLPIPSQVIGFNPSASRRYIRAFSVAFFETYVANRSQYRSYLSVDYARAISTPPLDLSLIHSLSADQLTQLIKTSLMPSQKSH